LKPRNVSPQHPKHCNQPYTGKAPAGAVSDYRKLERLFCSRGGRKKGRVDKSQRPIRLAVKLVDQGSEITTAIANASATCSALMRLIGPGNEIGIIFRAYGDVNAVTRNYSPAGAAFIHPCSQSSLSTAPAVE